MRPRRGKEIRIISPLAPPDVFAATINYRPINYPTERARLEPAPAIDRVPGNGVFDPIFIGTHLVRNVRCMRETAAAIFFFFFLIMFDP